MIRCPKCKSVLDQIEITRWYEEGARNMIALNQEAI